MNIKNLSDNVGIFIVFKNKQLEKNIHYTHVELYKVFVNFK